MEGLGPQQQDLGTSHHRHGQYPFSVVDSYRLNLFQLTMFQTAAGIYTSVITKRIGKYSECTLYKWYL